MEIRTSVRLPVPPLAVPIPEAARLTGLGRSTLYKLITEGRLETSKVGRRRLVIYASLRSLLEGQQ